MSTFFFAMNAADCSRGCQGGWQTCPQRYLWALRQMNGLHDICTLFGGHSRFAPVPGGFPQNGDLIILYAKDLHDLEAMIGAGDIFDGLKKILVVADARGIDDRQYHMLAPRYITQAGRDMTELEAVIGKMKNLEADSQKG